MSGMCAIVHFDGRPVDPVTTARMADAAAYRGPDGIGTWRDGSATLLHLAAHLTPQETSERQPLSDGRYVLVADARIDNRDDLVPFLRSKRQVATHDPSDAELILAAHRTWGHEAPGHLVGDFAYAVFDTEARSLLAARDPLGMRACHYHAGNGLLVLATEIGQLLAHPSVPVELFEPMVAAHLAGPYGRDEWTFYAGIHQLAPGHALSATSDGVRTWRYWAIDPEERVRYRRESDYAEHLRELLQRAVVDRSRTTKAIGIMLSGGLDSGGIASTLGRQSDRGDAAPTFTYSWGFASADLADGDERSVSDRIAHRFGFRPRTVLADDLWPLKGYPEHGPDRSAPYVLVYQALFDHAFEMARTDGVGALWVGDRGDELFGDWVFDHPGMLLSGRWLSLAHELRTHARWSGRSLRSVLRRHLLRPLWDDVTGSRRSPSRPNPRVPPHVRSEWALGAGLAETLTLRPSEGLALTSAGRERFDRAFFFRGIRDPGLHERRAARYGLTVVDPFSDARIVRFVLAVPGWVLQRPTEPKRLLRHALSGVMPDDALRSSRKAEPNALFERGFRERSRDVVRELLTDSELARRGYVDEAALRAQYEAYLVGGPVRHDFWWPLTLEMWLRRYWA